VPEPSQENLENRSLVKYKLMVDEFGPWALFQRLLTTCRAIADLHNTTIKARNDKDGAFFAVSDVAIAFVLRKACVGGVILGARNARHLPRTLRASTLSLSEADCLSLEEVMANATGPSGAFYGLERDKDGKHGAVMRYNLNRVFTSDFHLPELQERVEACLDGKVGLAAPMAKLNETMRLQLLDEATHFQQYINEGAGADTDAGTVASISKALGVMNDRLSIVDAHQ
jgi:hypothetical protein